MTQTLLAITGKPHISFSSFTTWLDCGERFRLQRVENIQEDPAYYLAGGTAVHVGTEKFDEMLFRGIGFFESVNGGVAAFQHSFEEALAARPGAAWRAAGRKTAAQPNGEDADFWRHSGVAQVQKYADWRSSFHNYTLWQTEAGIPGIELAVDTTFTGDVLLKGYIDRVFSYNGQQVIVDLKSGSREPASPLQLAVYAIGMEKQYGIRPRFGAYYMTRKGELSAIVDLSVYTEAMLARWFRDFKRSVEAEVFIPHVTSMCGSCGVRQACTAINPGANVINFESDLNVTSTLGVPHE